MYQTTIGAHHHRSHRDDGYRLPDGVRVASDWMRAAGYFTANIRTFPKEAGFAGTGKASFANKPLRNANSARKKDGARLAT